MRVQCPECDARLRVSLPDDDSRIKCPKCGTRFRPENDDDDDDEEEEAPRSRVKRSGKKGKTKKFPVFEVAGGVLAAILAVGAVIWVVVARPKPAPQPVANATPADPIDQQAVPKFVGPRPGSTPPPPLVQNNPNVDAGLQPGAVTTVPPAEETPVLPELFRRSVSSPPPKFRAGVLTPDPGAPPLDVPTFYSLKLIRQAGKPAPTPKAAKLTLDEIKQATTYIKVEAGESLGSGSGFLIGVMEQEAFIATNYHVISRALTTRPGASSPSKISVVFNSGVPGTQLVLTARVLAFDPFADLAVLRVTTGAKMPKPIDPWQTPKLTETMEVRICGFPLGIGREMSEGGRFPNISIGPGSVSSLRTDKAGKLDEIEINGALNPGNSGGPIVDKDGRLVGIAVRSINRTGLGAGIGWAVPVNDLIALLEGKLLATLFLPTGLEDGRATFQVVIPVMDPLSRVKKVYVRYWTGLGPRPTGVKDPKIGWKPIERAEQVNLDVPDTPSSLSVASGELRVPQDTTEVVLQIASENDSGLVAASPPVTYKLELSDIETGSDAKPFTALTSNPEPLAGQVVVVRGRIVTPPASRADVQELVVADSDGKRPQNFRFFTTRELATQFDELETEDESKPVRVTCVVGVRGSDGVVPVRVARVDFLGRANRVVKSIPGATPTDPLAALNRNPKKFAGEDLELKASAVPVVEGGKSGNDLVVMFPNNAQPRNLTFVLAPGLAEKVGDEKLTPNGIYRVRLSAKVGTAPARSSAPVTVTVRKIEILDTRNDTVRKTIE